MTFPCVCVCVCFTVRKRQHLYWRKRLVVKRGMYLSDVYASDSCSESLLVPFAKKSHTFHEPELHKVQVQKREGLMGRNSVDRINQFIHGFSSGARDSAMCQTLFWALELGLQICHFVNGVSVQTASAQLEDNVGNNLYVEFFIFDKASEAENGYLDIFLCPGKMSPSTKTEADRRDGFLSDLFYFGEIVTQKNIMVSKNPSSFF